MTKQTDWVRPCSGCSPKAFKTYIARQADADRCVKDGQVKTLCAVCMCWRWKNELTTKGDSDGEGEKTV